VRLYHRTDHADTILAGGFQDGEGGYGTLNVYRGVWLSNVPLDANEGAQGSTLLTLDMPEEQAAEYEWIEDWKQYREFLIPAEVVNRYGPPQVAVEV